MVDLIVDYPYYPHMRVRHVGAMNHIVWDNLRFINKIIENGEFKSLASKVDGLLNSVSEAVADALPSATADLLHDGAGAAVGALNTLRSKEKIDRLSLDFVAGRLAATADVLGFAAASTADETAVAKARHQPYARILQALHEAPLRNTDLTRNLGVHKSQISRYLTELRDMEMVTSHQQGREVFNGLTPAGRLVVEEGISDRQRAPLAQSNLHDMKAYSLANKNAPNDAEPTIPALIRAC